MSAIQSVPYTCRVFCVEAQPHDGFIEETWCRDMDIILDEAEHRETWATHVLMIEVAYNC